MANKKAVAEKTNPKAETKVKRQPDTFNEGFGKQIEDSQLEFALPKDTSGAKFDFTVTLQTANGEKTSPPEKFARGYARNKIVPQNSYPGTVTFTRPNKEKGVKRFVYFMFKNFHWDSLRKNHQNRLISAAHKYIRDNVLVAEREAQQKAKAEQAKKVKAEKSATKKVVATKGSGKKKVAVE